MTFTVTAYTGDKITVGSVKSRSQYDLQVDAGLKGDVGYTGSIGYTGSVGVGYTGSQGIVGYTGSMGTLQSSVTINQLKEPVVPYNNISGEVIHDGNTGTYLLIVNPTGNIIFNISNLNLDVNQTTTVKFSIVQPSATSYMVQTLKIDGVVPQTYWPDGIIPSGNPGKYDDVIFEIYRFNTTGYVVKGHLLTYQLVTV